MRASERKKERKKEELEPDMGLRRGAGRRTKEKKEGGSKRRRGR